MTTKTKTKTKRKRRRAVREPDGLRPNLEAILRYGVTALASALVTRAMEPPLPDPDTFQYRTCPSCADCPACGLPRRAHDSDPVAARTHTRNS